MAIFQLPSVGELDITYNMHQACEESDVKLVLRPLLQLCDNQHVEVASFCSEALYRQNLPVV
jgi:hypothetical protein